MDCQTVQGVPFLSPIDCWTSPTAILVYQSGADGWMNRWMDYFSKFFCAS